MDNINPELVAKAIGFHGQPLQKIWEGERGENDLTNMGVVNPDYSAYLSRQKHFSFQDRAKRLKLHQFIARKANILYHSNLLGNLPPPRQMIGEDAPVDGKLFIKQNRTFGSTQFYLIVFLF